MQLYRLICSPLFAMYECSFYKIAISTMSCCVYQTKYGIFDLHEMHWTSRNDICCWFDTRPALVKTGPVSSHH